jgi:hypothetical protein
MNSGRVVEGNSITSRFCIRQLLRDGFAFDGAPNPLSESDQDGEHGDD